MLHNNFYKSLIINNLYNLSESTHPNCIPRSLLFYCFLFMCCSTSAKSRSFISRARYSSISRDELKFLRHVQFLISFEIAASLTRVTRISLDFFASRSSKRSRTCSTSKKHMNNKQQKTQDLVTATSISYRDMDGQYIFQALDVIAHTTFPPTNLTSKDPDKFLVSADDLTTARQEFFDRWRTFSKRYFKRFIRIHFDNHVNQPHIHDYDLRRTSQYTA